MAFFLKVTDPVVDPKTQDVGGVTLRCLPFSRYFESAVMFVDAIPFCCVQLLVVFEGVLMQRREARILVPEKGISSRAADAD